MKKILFVASECVPFIKTGGLADVCGALPKEFDKNYWDVRVVIPDYSCIPEQYRNNFEYVTATWAAIYIIKRQLFSCCKIRLLKPQHFSQTGIIYAPEKILLHVLP